MIPEETFEDAFFWALNYNGWEMHADAMREYIADPNNRTKCGNVNYPRGESACVVAEDVRNDNPNSILWMCLVQMFGDYGSSPRYGWIEHPNEAAEWLRKRQRATYHGDTYDAGWCETDEEISEAIAEWERDHEAERRAAAIPVIENLAERLQDEFIELCRNENHGPLSDEQYAACLRTLARRKRRFDESFDEALKARLEMLDKVSKGGESNEWLESNA